MSRPRPNATPNIKAKTRPTDVHVIGGRAISADRIENVQGRVSIVQVVIAFATENTGPEEIGGPTIDNKGIDLLQSSGRCRRSR